LSSAFSTLADCLGDVRLAISPDVSEREMLFDAWMHGPVRFRIGFLG
jgi:hypothetical protein